MSTDAIVISIIVAMLVAMFATMYSDYCKRNKIPIPPSFVVGVVLELASIACAIWFVWWLWHLF